MKIKVDNDILQMYVSAISKFTPARSPLPAAEFLMLDAKPDGCLWIKTSDPFGAVSASCRMEVPVEEAGEVLIPAKMLTSILKQATSIVEIESDGKTCDVRFGESSYTLATMDPTEFPAMQVALGEKIMIPQFGDLVTHTSAFAAKDGNLNAIWFHVDGGIKAEALTGYAGAVWTGEAEGKGDFAIRADHAEKIAALMDCAIDVTVDKKTVRFDSHSFSVTVARVMNDPFGLEKVCPKNIKGNFTFNTETLKNAVDAVSIVTEREPVDICFDSVTELSVKSASASASAKVPCSMDGEKAEVSFNPKFLADVLKRCDDEVTVEAENRITAFCFRSGRGFFLVLPVKRR